MYNAVSQKNYKFRVIPSDYKIHSKEAIKSIWSFPPS